VPELGNALEHTRLINLIGPRQVGKTTRVRDRFARGHFVSLDEAATLAAIETVTRASI
jgi:predicted AAA+ superfamily ATPase